MAALASALYRSPDLTFEHAKFLRGDYLNMLVAMHAEMKEQQEKQGALESQEAFPQVADILRLQ
jgi:hypothetical protein